MIHNTHVSQFIPPTAMHYVTGTWSDAAGAVTGTIVKVKAAADNTATVTIPILVPSCSITSTGSKLVSVEVDYEVQTAAMDAVSAAINKVTRGANGADAVVASVAFSYDTGHDTAGERIAVDEHRMTLTITTPTWLDNDDYYLVQLTMDAAATSVLHILGAVANFTLRL